MGAEARPRGGQGVGRRNETAGHCAIEPSEGLAGLGLRERSQGKGSCLKGAQAAMALYAALELKLP